MNDFEFEYKTKVHFGTGVVKKRLAEVLSFYGNKVILCYGKGSVKKNGVYDEVYSILEGCGKTVIAFGDIMPNPTYKKAQDGARIAREEGVELVIALGGGSVIDCAKVIAAQAVTDEDIWDMRFVKGVKPDKYLPLIAVVTLFGTGAEMNSGAVITNEEKGRKACVYGAFCDHAFMDIGYTLSVPLLQVKSGAFDTLSHCMETYFSAPTENNLSDDMNEAIMRSVINNMRLLDKEPYSEKARSELAWASAMAENGVLKIGKAVAFQAHQIEHQLGAFTDCNHGLGLAVIHPPLYEKIYAGGVERFKRFALNVFGVKEGKTDEETALGGIKALRDFIREVGLPATLKEIGVTDKSVIKKVAQTANIYKGCFTTLTREEIEEILLSCFG